MADTTIAANTSTSESSSSSQDSYNPNDRLVLHPRENPGAVLTPQPLSGGRKLFYLSKISEEVLDCQ